MEKLPIFMIPWLHNVILLAKVKNNNERMWYAQKTIQEGWSSTILEHKIESNLYKRQGKAITNFKQILPQQESANIQQILKDP